jgi:UDP-2,3-diacylglucosamine pyrophosphatase LpxH
MGLRRILFIFAAALAAATGLADPGYRAPLKSEGRYLAVVSDMHMSYGEVNDRWHPYEDFRWSKAFHAFLTEISMRGNDRVDLVIAGDFLELWQAPDDIACYGNGMDLGCSIPEIVEITRRIVRGHNDTLKELAAFSQKGDNRVHVIPGNHDAALMLKEVWDVLGAPLQVESGRIQWVRSGIWTSHDGCVIIEHGHQIPGDANRFDNWPVVADRTRGLLFRPGGELFVQKLFNEVECTYPIIDNLSPEVLGAWYRMQDRGVWGSIADMARFIIFYLFETSLAQKTAFLGEEEAPKHAKAGAWDVAYGRNKLNWRLAAYAMPLGSNLRAELLTQNPDHKVDKLRRDLATIVVDPKRLSDDEVRQLCDQAWLVSKQPCLDTATLGELLNRLPGVRPWLLRRHLESRRKEFPKMSHFIFGHTHELKPGYNLRITDTTDDKRQDMQVVVYNSGAFQRLMNSESYETRLADRFPGADTSEGLRKLTLEKDFPRCYTAVLAPFEDGFYRPETKRWFMYEDANQGKIVEADFALCKW